MNFQSQTSLSEAQYAASMIFYLDLRSAGFQDGIARLGKHRRQVVPGRLHRPSPELLPDRGHRLAASGYWADGRRFVLSHQAGPSLSVRAEDGGLFSYITALGQSVNRYLRA